LIDALNRYQGSLILVSHDRYFISKTANKIWEIVDKKIKVFKGTYEEWVEWKERAESRNQSIAPPSTPVKEEKKEVSKSSTNGQPAKSNAAANTPINKEAQKELQKQQKLFQQLERQLAELNKQKAELEGQLSHPSTYADPEAFKKTENAYRQVQDKLAGVNNDYEKVFEKIMNLEEQQS
jgi:ATP-binding cassette, subfamily F, member 3